MSRALSEEPNTLLGFSQSPDSAATFCGNKAVIIEDLIY
jgi:hypothetical protein